MNPLKPSFSPGRSGPMGSSFLPEDYLRQKKERRGNMISLALFCVVMFGVTAAFFVTNRQWTSVKSRQREINVQYSQEAKKIEQLKVLEAQKTEMLGKAEITAALIERVPRSILLAELINRMPENLTLTDLKLSGKRLRDAPVVSAAETQAARTRSLAGPSRKPAAKGKAVAPPAPKVTPPRYEFTLQLVGLAADDKYVADYHASLKQCPLLEQVDLLSSSAVKIDDNQRRRFLIEATIRPSADARNIQPLKIPRNSAFSTAGSSSGWMKKLGFTRGNAQQTGGEHDAEPGSGGETAQVPDNDPTTADATPRE